jgi:outer membrane protein insertion porin family
VTIVPVAVDTTLGRADLVVRVIERKPAFYEVGVGVGSLERIRVLASWGHYNLWGTGRRVQIRTRGSWNVEDVVGNPISFDQGQFNYLVDALYVNPHIRGSRFSFDLDVYTKRETRGESGLNLLSHGVNVGSTWRPNRRVTNNAFLGWKVTSPTVHPYAPDSLKVRFEELGTTSDEVRSINWATYIDHRDDLYRPTRGMYTVGTLKLAGGIMGGDFSFLKWSGAWHYYQEAPVGGVVAFRCQLGGTRPYGSSLDQGADGVPYDDRFFAGGASTVRGYANNSLGPQVTDQDELDRLNYSSDVLLPDNPARGGNYIMLTNVEWRFPLPGLRKWKFSSVLFFEGGNVWADLSDIRIKGYRLHSIPGDPQDPASTKVWDYRYSWGTGIRFDTPFGPVRVDVGFPLKRVRYVSDTQDRQDPKVLWHFSLGYPF